VEVKGWGPRPAWLADLLEPLDVFETHDSKFEHGMRALLAGASTAR
jgi:hypothetical protein